MTWAKLVLSLSNIVVELLDWAEKEQIRKAAKHEQLIQLKLQELERQKRFADLIRAARDAEPSELSEDPRDRANKL